MFASIGEPTSHVISSPTYSEDEIYRHDTSDYEQGIAEEEEEETDYETDYETDPRSVWKPRPKVHTPIRRLKLVI